MKKKILLVVVMALLVVSAFAGKVRFFLSIYEEIEKTV